MPASAYQPTGAAVAQGTAMAAAAVLCLTVWRLLATGRETRPTIPLSPFGLRFAL